MASAFCRRGGGCGSIGVPTAGQTISIDIRNNVLSILNAKPSAQGLAEVRFHMLVPRNLPLGLLFLVFAVIVPTPALLAQTDIAAAVGAIEITRKFIREHGGEEHGHDEEDEDGDGDHDHGEHDDENNGGTTVLSFELSRHFTEGVIPLCFGSDGVFSTQAGVDYTMSLHGEGEEHGHEDEEGEAHEEEEEDVRLRNANTQQPIIEFSGPHGADDVEIEIASIDNTVPEGTLGYDRSFTIDLCENRPAGDLRDDPAGDPFADDTTLPVTVTIIDDDVPARAWLSVAHSDPVPSVSVLEGDSLELAVNLSKPVERDTVFEVTVLKHHYPIEQQALRDDYTVPGSVTVHEGEDHADFSITTASDDRDFRDGKFDVNVALPSGLGPFVRDMDQIAVNIVDTENQPPPLYAACAAYLPTDAVSVGEVKEWRYGHRYDDAHVLRWNQVLAALGEDTGEVPLSAEGSKSNESRFRQDRWGRVTRTLEGMNQCVAEQCPTGFTREGENPDGAPVCSLVVNPADYDALKALYDATDGPNWTNNTNWLSASPLAEWYGVRTRIGGISIGRVFWLDLRDNGLSGTIPPQLGDLTELQTRLDLSHNQLAGPIPSELSKLTKLAYLDLSDNMLTGDIPAEFGNWTVIHWLFLQNNQLSGILPAELTNIPFSSHLHLDVRNNAGICAPATPAFQAWIQGIGSYDGCGDVDPVDPPEAIPVDPVTNVQVTKVNAATARVTWDPVEHATFYRAQYETRDPDTLVSPGNYLFEATNGLTETRWTFQHDAAEAMTLTVTVTPGYVDDQEVWRLVENLAGTATIDVAPAGTGSSDSIGNGGSTDNGHDDGGTETGNTPQLPDYSALKAKIQGYAGEQASDSDHAQRWMRVLAALGDADAIAAGHDPMTASEAQGYADRGWSRWDEVVDALTELESRETAEPEPEPEPDPIPELSLSGGGAVDEGGSASFTIHAAPAPASGVTVSVTVSQSGDYLDLPGAGTRTITLATGAATASLSVATADDSADEPDGSISVSIDSGTGYTVASSNHTASVTVRDNDDPPPVRTIGACVSLSQWKTVKGYYDSNAYRFPNYGANWYRVLVAYHEDRGDQTMPDWVGATSKPSSAYTVKEAERSETVWSGWTPVRKVLQCLEKESGQSFAPLLPSSSNPAYGGVVRFVNASPQGGSVNIQATDDSGWSPPPVTLHVGPGESVHLTTGDLEQGNAAKGLSGYLGAATGDWRLDVSSERDIRMLPYVRAHDGVLAPMHAVAEAERGVHRVSAFAPADDPGVPGRTGLLRLINRGGEALTAHIAGTDDSGAASGEVSLAIPAGESVLLTAAELEGGASGLRGALGDGRGMWRLDIASGGDLAVMSLLRSGGGHLTNLSGGASPAARSSEVHAVPYFPSASDPLGRQGLVRVVNGTGNRATVRVQPHDDAGRRYEPLTLALGAGEAAHLNSWDLETGNASGGLSGRTGSGTGDWRLDIAGPPGVEVLAYVRTLTGVLVPVHDVADASGRTHELPIFNPAGGAVQAGQLRIVNPGPLPARVTIRGRDDGGNPSRDTVRLTVGAGETRVVEAAELETGQAMRGALDGALGDGAGHWRIEVESDRPVLLMNLAESRDGRIVNLSSGAR